jgi:hypothetical protein
MNSVQLRAGQTSQPFTVGIGSIVTITPSSIGGGTGYVEYSLSPAADILNGLGVWNRWPLGSVSVTTSKTALFVFQARAVCITGSLSATFGDPTNSLALSVMTWDANEVISQYDATGNFIGTNSVGTTSTTPAFLWANRPAATSSNVGQYIRITDVGGNTGSGGGNYFFSNGLRWKPLNGSILLDGIDTANTSVANTTEQNLNPNHIVIPAGVIGDFDRLRIRFTATKSSTVDTSVIRLRFGPLGTIADPAILTISGFSTTNISMGSLIDFKRTSATTIEKLGNGLTNNPYSGFSTIAFPADVTISSMDANPMFLSITSQMTTGAETVSLVDYTMELCPTDSQ